MMRSWEGRVITYMKLKDRVVVVSEKNMDNLISLYGKCSREELERIVNNMIDNAVAEINEDREVSYAV